MSGVRKTEIRFLLDERNFVNAQKLRLRIRRIVRLLKPALVPVREVGVGVNVTQSV